MNALSTAAIALPNSQKFKLIGWDHVLPLNQLPGIANS